jgi:transposase
MRPWAPEQIVREYVYAFGAVSPHDGVLDTLVLPTVSADTMSLFLDEISARHPDDFIVMVLDGAGWHKAHQLRVPPNMKLVSLPPYSPQLNPVEHLWEELREKSFPNLVFPDLDAMEDRLVDALATLEADVDRVQSIAGFHWIVDIPLVAN